MIGTGICLVAAIPATTAVQETWGHGQIFFVTVSLSGHHGFVKLMW
jgi:hypothetical protein